MKTEFSVLVIEESETQALGIRLQLEHEGWTVSCVSTGNAAFAEFNLVTANDHLPSLIIVNDQLTDFTGEEFCLQVRRDLRTRNIPILMLIADQEDHQHRGARVRRLPIAPGARQHR